MIEYAIMELADDQEGGFCPRGAVKELWNTRDFECIVSGPAECVAGETLIDDPTGKPKRIDDLCKSGLRPVVQTANGPVLAEVPFAKGIAPLYRVKFSDGSSFLATRRHLILTEVGWTFVGEIRVGDRVPSSARSPRLCDLVASRSIRAEDGQNWNRKRSVPRADCLTSRQMDRGERPQLVAAGDQVSFPSQVDARGLARASHNLDAQASIAGHNHLHQSCARPSSDHCQPPSGYAGCDERRFWRPIRGLGLCSFRPRGQFRKTKLLRQPFGLRTRGCDHRHLCVFSWNELYHNELELVQWKLVESVEFERIDKFYDLHVPEAEHYSAHGVWHHNTGKTWGCLNYLDMLLWTFPGAQGVMCRKIYSTLVSSAVRSYLRILGPNTPVKAFGGEKPQWFDYPNGSRLWLAGMDNPGKALSSERDVIYANQVEELTLNDWETLTTRCTGRGAVMPYTRMFGDANPAHPTHWIKARQSVGALTLLESRHEDNPTLYDEQGQITEQGKRTLKILDSLTGTRLLRLRWGRWVKAEGVVFEDFDVTIHLKAPEKLPIMRKYVCGVDWGFTNPGVIGVWGVDGDGRQYLVREYVRTKRVISQWVETAKEIQDKYFPEIFICDPAEPAFIADFRAAGLTAIEGYNDIEKGIDAIRQRLRPADDGLPRLFVSSGALVERDPNMEEAKQPIGLAEEFDAYSYPKGVDGKPIKETPLDMFNHSCFPAGSLVDTPDGPRRIETILSGEQVLSHLGVAVVDAGAEVTGIKPLIEVVFDDGTRIMCTADHPLLSCDGWVAAADALSRKILCRSSPIDLESAKRSSSALKSLPMEDSTGSAIQTARTILCETTSGAQSSSMEHANTIGFTSKSSVIFMDQSQPAWSSTTRMKTPETMSQITLRRRLRQNTRCCIAAISPRLSPLPQHGTLPTRAERGIPSTQKRRGGTEWISQSNASNAAPNTRPLSRPNSRDFVPTNARPLLAACRVSTTSSGSANRAGRNSASIAIQRRRIAPVDALGKECVCVRSLDGKSPVYNLATSDGTFCVNGVIVSNCDAARYVTTFLDQTGYMPDDGCVGIPAGRYRRDF